MFAIIKTGGKQYSVSKNTKIRVESLNIEEGKEIEIKEIIFFRNEDGTVITEKDSLSKITVVAEISRNFKNKKILVFKKKRRKNYRRTKGHRQMLTEIIVKDIIINNNRNYGT